MTNWPWVGNKKYLFEGTWFFPLDSLGTVSAKDFKQAWRSHVWKLYGPGIGTATDTIRGNKKGISFGVNFDLNSTLPSWVPKRYIADRDAWRRKQHTQDTKGERMSEQSQQYERLVLDMTRQAEQAAERLRQRIEELIKSYGPDRWPRDTVLLFKPHPDDKDQEVRAAVKIGIDQWTLTARRTSRSWIDTLLLVGLGKLLHRVTATQPDQAIQVQRSITAPDEAVADG